MRAHRTAALPIVKTANLEPTHTHEKSANTPPPAPATAADEEVAQTTSHGTDDKADHAADHHVQPAPAAAAKSGWASKFKFGKKSSDA